VSGETRTRGTPLRGGDPQRLGAYELVSRLGEGGMGVVYLAADANGRLGALKLIRSDLADEPEFRRRFRSEVTRAAEVPPFCTAEVLDADPDHDPPYLVVEYVDGPSLAEVVVDRGPLSASNLYALAIGVATALTAIHGAGVIHRDLKPSNVLLAPGSPKVIDFGIARAADASDGETRTDQLIGTVAYMAPERLDPVGRAPITPAADIFAWGAVVTFAATGRAPWQADSSPATAVAILTRDPELDGVAEPLRCVVARALAKDPAQRPSARELLDELLTMAHHAKTRPAAPASGDQQQMTTGAAAARLVLDGAEGSVGGGEEAGACASATSAPGSGASGSGGGSGTSGNGTSGSGTSGSGAAGIPRQSRTNIGDPEEGIATDVVSSAWRRRSPGRGIGMGAAAVLLIALAAGVAGVVRGDIRLGSHAGPAISPATVTSAPSPSASPSGDADPFPGGSSFFDALTTPANWHPTRAPSNFDSSCTIDGGLIASIAGYSSYRCEGYITNVADFAAEADVTLLRAESCASIWFHFTGQNGPQGGYALLVCPNGVSLRTHTDKASGGGDLIGTSDASSWTPLALGVTTHIELTLIDNYLTVTRDGVTVLQQATPNYRFGRLILGIYQPKPRSGPVRNVPPDKFYSVRFNNLHIWTPPGGSAPTVTPSP
jgi:eukaryotic-like serine/threonine-protein kinase